MNKICLLIGLIVVIQIQCKVSNEKNQGKIKYQRCVRNFVGDTLSNDTLHIIFDKDILCLFFTLPNNKSNSDTLIEFIGYNAKLNKALIKLSTDNFFRDYDYGFVSDSLVSAIEVSDTSISGRNFHGLFLKYKKKKIWVYQGIDRLVSESYLKFKNSLYIDVFLFSKSIPEIFIVETNQDVSTFKLIKSDYNQLDVDLNQLFQ
jgi:hypothetical protein